MAVVLLHMGSTIFVEVEVLAVTDVVRGLEGR